MQIQPGTYPTKPKIAYRKEPEMAQQNVLHVGPKWTIKKVESEHTCFLSSLALHHQCEIQHSRNLGLVEMRVKLRP